jgi:hypothetical protein
MTFASNTHDNATAESHDPVAAPTAPVHIEETPCVIILTPAAAAALVHTRWQPRTMQAWLT